MKNNTPGFKTQCRVLASLLLILLLHTATPLWAASSANIPLDSPVYLYLDKLAGFGLITSDIKGIKPFSKAEAARLLREAEDSSRQAQRAAPAAFSSLLALR